MKDKYMKSHSIIKEIIRKVVKESKSSKMTLKDLLGSNLQSQGASMVYVIGTSSPDAIELKVVPNNENDTKWLQTNARAFANLIKSEKLHDKIIEKYNITTGSQVEYIDDIYSTVNSILYYVG